MPNDLFLWIAGTSSVLAAALAWSAHRRTFLGLAARYRAWVASRLDELQWSASPSRVVAGHLALTVAATLLVAWAWHGLAALAVPPASAWGARAFWFRAVARRRQRFAEQLPAALHGLSASLEQGLNLEQAFTLTAENADEPTRSELLNVVKEYQLARPLHESLTRTALRMDNRNLGLVAEAVAVASRAGGKLSAMLRSTAHSVQEIARLEEKMDAATAQGRMQTRVIVLLGPAALVAVTLIAPETVEPLFTDPLGWLMIGAAAVLDVVGVLLAKKIQEADV